MTGPERDTPSSESAQVWAAFVAQVSRLHGLLVDQEDDVARRAGLTPARWQVLDGVSGEGRTVSQLARRAGLTRQSVQRTVNLLVDEGLVTLADNIDHKTAKLVRLTPAGAQVLSRLTRAERRRVRASAERVSTHRLRAAGRVLEDVERRLTDG